MIKHNFSQDFHKLNSKEYLKVYEKQSLNYQDFFHHPEFQYSCLSVFSENTPCYLLSVYNDDILIGYAAFRTEKIKLRKRNYDCLVPASYMISEYNYPVIDKNCIDVFFKALNDVFIDYNVYYHNTTAFFKKRFLNLVEKSFVHSVVENPVLRNVGDDMEKASKKKGMLRDFKALSKKHELEIEHLQNDISEHNLEDFFRLHIKRWGIVGIQSKFLSKQYQEIYKNLSKLNINGPYYMVFSYLKVDGETIATHIGFSSNKRFIYHNVAYDIDHRSKSPGSILLLKILEYNFENKMEVFDMGYGVEDYKYRFMNDIDTYFNIVRFKNKLSRLYNRLDLKD